MTIHPGNVPPLLPDNIVQNVFLGNGIEILESQYSGTKASVGLFDNALSSIGLERGIVLSTGFAEKMLQPNMANAPINGSSSAQSITDADLEALAGVQVQDIAKFEITFVPASDNLSFRYVFASEEYPKFVCGDKNDVFGFFITGPKPGGGNYNSENIARVPDPNDASMFMDLPVTINSVNAGQPGIFADGGACDGPSESLAYSQYYNSVPENGSPSFNAFLDVFSAKAAVIPCETYTIKIAIGDGKDQNEDSAVFLEERSFSTEAIKVNINNPGIEGGLAEDCEVGGLNFSLAEPTLVDLPLDVKILSSSDLVNPALPGIDFIDIEENIIIKAGESSVDLSLVPITDNETEGTEFIYLSLQKSLCTVDTIIMPLYDNVLKSVDLMDTIVACAGDKFVLEADLGDVNQADNLIYKNDELTELSILDGYLASTIEVSGLKDIALNPSIIGEICIDKLQHPHLDHLDIYLTAPSGQILELSTDNGFSSTQVSGLLQTCFSAYANNNINRGNSSVSNADPGNPNYTGTYLPEGSFDDWLHPITSELNGEYILHVIDDTKEHPGELNGWSISFNPKYELDYNWSPTNGLVCAECELTEGQLDASQFYYLNLTDSYGCTFQDSVWIEIQQSALTPEVVCEAQGEGNIIVTWDETTYAENYEFKIVGKERWYSSVAAMEIVVGSYKVEIVDRTQLQISGILPDEEVTVLVRAINRAGCNSEIAEATCSPRPCTTPLPEIIEITVEHPQCSADLTGKVIVTAESDSGPLSYIIRLQNNTGSNSNGTLRNIPPGTWPLRIVDSMGCAIEDSVVVEEPPIFELVSEFTNSTCADADDGIISLDITAENNPTKVLWSDGSEESMRSGLAGGIYTVTVTDAEGCELVEEYENINPNILVHTYIQTALLDCAGGGDATGTVFVYGGLPPYTTTWDGNIVADTLTNLVPGEISYQVEDAYGCVVSDVATIFQVDGLEITFSDVSDTPCENESAGTATATVSNGSGTYTYLWSSGESTVTATALSAGDNSVTVHDAAGCQTTATIEISAPNAILIDEVNLNHPSCAAEADGSIELTASGGIGNLSYAWDDGTRENNVTGLDQGNMCVTITDESYCEISECFELINPDPISFTVETSKVSCDPGGDGRASLNISGGSGEFIYQWTGPNNFTSSSEELTGLDVGEYSVQVIEASNGNCLSLLQTFLIENASDLSSEITTLAQISCHQDNDGVLYAETTGGQAPFTFLWSTGSDQQEISELGTDEYTVTVTDSGNCQAIAEMVLTAPEVLELTLESQDIYCMDMETGEITLYINGGTAPYQQEWNTGSTQNSLSELAPGNYSVTVTDSNGCITTESAMISSPENALEISADVQNESCYSEENGSITIFLENATEPMSYQLDNEPRQSNNVFSDLAGGQYLITVVDGNGCTTSLEIQVESAEEIELEIVGDLSVGYGNDLTLEAKMSNTYGEVSYQWSAPDMEMLSCSDCMSPVISNIVKSFSASLSIVDETGCTYETYFNVNVVDLNELVVPTGFSPNSDGMNDRLSVYGSSDIIINEFVIYNEMGQVVFSSSAAQVNDEATGWDGTYQGSSLPVGSYVWTLNFTCPDGRTESKTGQSTLIR